MKKTQKGIIMNRITTIVALSFAVISCLQAQELPIDSSVKTGKLENGLSYYIRPNSQMKGITNFYLVCNVGAVDEEDAENGLAHFTEHMAFQGTRNFKGDRLLSYMNSIGVRFGENLNVVTHKDRTVYRITDVLTTQEAVVDSCLLVLSDWIDGITMEEKAIEKERTVICEEIRLRNMADFRIYQAFYEQLIPDNIYAKRNILGGEDMIMNFDPANLKRFYQKWYRPDLAAVIVVGDIEADVIEQKIKTLFSSIPGPKNKPERITPEPVKRDAPLIALVAEKEATYPWVSVEFLHPPLAEEKRGSVDEVMSNYLRRIGVILFVNRLRECEGQDSTPFYLTAVKWNLFMNIPTEQVFGIEVEVQNKHYENATKSLFREIERVRRFGFTQLEYDQAKQELWNHIEIQMDKQDNASLAEQCIEHFLTGAYMTNPEIELQLYKALIEQVPLEALNGYYTDLLAKENRVLKIVMSQADSTLLPAKKQCLDWFASVEAEELTPYEREGVNLSLLTELPSGGSIVDETYDQRFGATVLTLSNGLKAIIKQTDFQKGKVEMKAGRPGGSSLLPEDNPANIVMYDKFANAGGLGEFNNKQIERILAGKNVQVNTKMNTVSEELTGMADVRDLETMFQLAYLIFTAPRIDEGAFQATLKWEKENMERKREDIISVISDSLARTAYLNQARHCLLPEDLSKVDYRKIMEWRKERYADASGFTFVFSGDIPVEEIKTLIARYLGSLPASNRKESYKEILDGYRQGHIRNVFSREMYSPKGISVILYSDILDRKLSDIMTADLLALILKDIYTNKIRMENGEVYSINAEAFMIEYPLGLLQLQVNFFCEPGKEDAINQILHNAFEEIARNGVEEFRLADSKEFLFKKQQTKEQQNQYWVETILEHYMTGYDSYTNYFDILNAISTEDIQKMADRILKTGNRIEVILTK